MGSVLVVFKMGFTSPCCNDSIKASNCNSIYDSFTLFVFQHSGVCHQVPGGVSLFGFLKDTFLIA